MTAAASAVEAVSPPRFVVPPGACDCHLHVFGPAGRYPLWAGRSYTPPDALPDQARHLLARLRLERVVVVQATPYGTDNARLVAALQEMGGAARGVAAVPTDVAPQTLRRLHAEGVRGARLHAHIGGIAGMIADMGALAGPVADLGWHLDLHLTQGALPAVAECALALPASVVLDHVAGLRTGQDRDGLAALQRLLDGGRAWVKISAPYRLAEDGPALEDLARLVRHLVRTHGERLLWGSDWPHTPPHAAPGEDVGAVRPFRAIDTGALLNQFGDWVEDEAARSAILVDNPARLYGF